MRKLNEKKIVVATHNDGKLLEIDGLMAPFGFETASAGQLGLPEPIELGSTFKENAYTKAVAAAIAADRPALSDDSGMEVDALDGAPGVYTADWAEEPNGHRDFVKAMQKVEYNLQQALKAKGLDDAITNRKARFVAVLCLAWPDGHAEYYRGAVEGHIVCPPRGEMGFGFDAIFEPENHGKTFGEMTADEKHGWKPWDAEALSHRARAFKLFAEAQLK